MLVSSFCSVEQGLIYIARSFIQNPLCMFWSLHVHLHECQKCNSSPWNTCKGDLHYTLALTKVKYAFCVCTSKNENTHFPHFPWGMYEEKRLSKMRLCKANLSLHNMGGGICSRAPFQSQYFYSFLTNTDINLIYNTQNKNFLQQLKPVTWCMSHKLVEGGWQRVLTI